MESIYTLKKGFCVVQYDLDLLTLFKVSTHSLTISNLKMKNEPDWVS